MSYENEVFDATVGDYTRGTLTRWGEELHERVAETVAAMEAGEVAIEVAVVVHGSDGKAEFKRHTHTVVWRDEEQLAALDAELEAEGASA